MGLLSIKYLSEDCNYITKWNTKIQHSNRHFILQYIDLNIEDNYVYKIYNSKKIYKTLEKTINK